MLKNYLKIAFRNLRQQKLYSLINIGGLAIGLAVCIMTMLYVTHEMTYDRFHKDADRTFKVQASLNIGGNMMNVAYMSYASGPLIRQQQPVVQDYSRTLKYFKPVVVANAATPETKFTEDKLLFADVNFFKFFTFKLRSGNTDDVLSKPFSVVLSQDAAKKYFGDADPVGKTIVIRTDSSYTYQVTGVAENAPSNSSIDYNFITSGASLLAMKEAGKYTGDQSIAPGSFDVFLKLNNAADTVQLRKNLDAIKTEKDSPKMLFSLSGLTEMHLHNNFGDYSNLKYLNIFPLVAVLILLLALVNYMSLTTAKATLRAKEVGVRKVSGASRKAIAAQFYVESALFTFLSFVLGYVLCYTAKPWFLNVLQLKMDNSFLYSPVVLGLLFGLFVLTALAAGIYPSVVLSGFKPVITLKGKMSKQAGGATVRKVFTTLQFAIAVGLIVCGIIIDRQLYFIRHTDTGVNRENVVMIPVGASFGQNYPAFNKDVQALAGISSVATSHYAMYGGYDMYFLEGKTKGTNIGLSALSVDDKFFSTLGLKWKQAPRANINLSAGQRVVINEEAVKKFELPANAVGSYIGAGAQKFEVAGVVKNFNFSSMQSAIGPLGLFVASDTLKVWSKIGCNLFARIKPHTNLPTLLGSIQSLYKKYDNDTPFSYSFMDDAFNKQYQAEDRLASIFGTFTYITILLATLGLFGLAAFTIEQRTKEIGIRKVLGASISTITSLLSKDFLKLVIIAVILASPVAWWAMNTWLQGFAYRIAVPWWAFAASGALAILTAIVTISYHALKAAFANPVKSLRSE